ncbi:MAG: hypothetical protein COU46_03575 [Candidatus Niyogibacteria bacterium CG10_big_fil_rev_8_21_14_0_10_42_19]|uniref:Type II secretion system protein GspH n=1 Tax=Candidatus Niyogibacteria bacterium CG10_big_fil_rev_8_21_14_0_10_42_19 TaxID=1974725 RepID=A0A2H0TES6_9BACT|nr:MAG: hypothetical protein COU46_03575 [Candidatus Niyogibacteria bacterium CG10_big_fil_rev_8_21_14_0_10_42_19]
MFSFKKIKNKEGFVWYERPGSVFKKIDIAGQQNKLVRAGFTIIELVVVIAIFATISSIILLNYPRVSQEAAINRSAQEIAVAFRRTQSFALGVRSFGGDFPGYGVYFSKSLPREYVIFADQNQNGAYDGVLEDKERFKMGGLPQITKLCVDTESAPPGNCEDATYITVFYLRPDPSVVLSSNLGTHSDVKIVLETSFGFKRSVVSFVGGQIETRDGE